VNGDNAAVELWLVLGISGALLVMVVAGIVWSLRSPRRE
jgi:hypothetical protein